MIAAILLIICIIILLCCIITISVENIKMYKFKWKLVIGRYIIHHYKKDDFTPVEDIKYLIVDKSAREIKLKDENGWTIVKTIGFMSPENYTILS